jgi:hypothetical protein
VKDPGRHVAVEQDAKSVPKTARIPVRIHSLERLRFMTGGAGCVFDVVMKVTYFCTKRYLARTP